MKLFIPTSNPVVIDRLKQVFRPTKNYSFPYCSGDQETFRKHGNDLRELGELASWLALSNLRSDAISMLRNNIYYREKCCHAVNALVALGSSRPEDRRECWAVVDSEYPYYTADSIRSKIGAVTEAFPLIPDDVCNDNSTATELIRAFQQFRRALNNFQMACPVDGMPRCLHLDILVSQMKTTLLQMEKGKDIDVTPARGDLTSEEILAELLRDGTKLKKIAKPFLTNLPVSGAAENIEPVTVLIETLLKNYYNLPATSAPPLQLYLEIMDELFGPDTKAVAAMDAHLRCIHPDVRKELLKKMVSVALTP